MQPPPLPKQKSSEIMTFLRCGTIFLLGILILIIVSLGSFLVYNWSLLSKARLAINGVSLTQDFENGGGGVLGGIVNIRFRYDKGSIHLMGPSIEGDTIYLDRVETDNDGDLIAIIKSEADSDPKNPFNLRIKVFTNPQNGIAFWVLNNEYYYNIEYPPQELHILNVVPEYDERLKTHHIDVVMPNGLHKML